MEKVRKLFYKYWHAVLLLYLAIYMPWFVWLNDHTPTQNPTPVYCSLDDLIPFCEWFAIPYFLWFVYIVAGHIFLFFSSQEDFVRMCIFLYTGMTVCLIIYTIWPNCQELRVDYDALGRTNFLIESIAALQSSDTPCNVFPSIHCLNSFGMHIAITKSKHLGRYREVIVAASCILMVLIVLSTVFVKQHSIIDMYGAIALSVPLYFLAYKTRLGWLRKDKD